MDGYVVATALRELTQGRICSRRLAEEVYPWRHRVFVRRCEEVVNLMRGHLGQPAEVVEWRMRSAGSGGEGNGQLGVVDCVGGGVRGCWVGVGVSLKSSTFTLSAT